MIYQTLIVAKKDNICTITLNRPESLNAMNTMLLQELENCLEECSMDKDIYVVILTGAGKAFCSGGDLDSFDGHPEGTAYALHEGTKYLNLVIIELRRMPQPVIASINGPVGGAGFSLMASCDFRIASNKAKFGQGYTRVGLVPDGAWTLTIPLLIGWGRASELLFTNPTLTAEDAMKWGLLNRIVPPEELADATWKLAQELARGPRLAFSIVKRNLTRGLLSTLEIQLEEDRRGIIMAAGSDDGKEGIKAFLEKRPPLFKDKPYF